VFANPAAAHQLGFDDPADVIGVEAIQTIAEGFRPHVVDRLRRIGNGTANPPVELEMITADGRSVFIESVSVPTTHGGRPAALVLGTDITERRRAQAELQASAQFARAIANTTPALIYLFDLPTQSIVWMNETHREILGSYFGANPEQISWQNLSALLHRDDRELLLDRMERLRTSPDGHSEEVEYRLRSADGGWRWLHDRALVFERDANGEPLRVIGTALDITARERSAEALERSEKHLSSIIRTAPVGIGLVEGRILREVNNQVCQMIGFAREELIGRSARLLYPTAEEFERVGREKYRQIAESGTGTVETVWQHRNGDTIYVLLSSTPVEPGNPGGPVMFTALDITRRVRFEADLRRSQRALTLANRIATAFLSEIADHAFTAALDLLLDAFQSPHGMLGYLEDGRTLVCPASILPGPSAGRDDHGRVVLPRESWEGIWGQTLRTRSTRSAETVTDAAGERIVLRSALAVPVLDADELIGLILVADRRGGYSEEDRQQLEIVASGVAPILKARLARSRAEGERRALEARLARSQRMEAIGQLAGGIAHDFNNILQAVFTHVELALGTLEPHHAATRHLEGVEFGARRAASLTRQLLAFGGRQVLQPSAVDLARLVEGIVVMLRAIIGEHIDLVLETSPGLPPALVDRAQIEQVVVNLVVNARDAMPEGGRVRIAVCSQDEHSDEPASPEQGLDPPMLCLVVEDTGRGMDDDTRRRAFEPFFTTKPSGQGSGLGLATVYGIVHQHGGTVEVSSTPGAGSRFRILLPSAAEGELAMEPVQPSEAITGGSETILVAEDEPSVRDLLVEALSRAGYTVLAAADGVEAFEVFSAHEHRIDLVLLDAVMPRLGGPGALDRIRAVRAAIPAILSTGYSADGDLGRHAAGAGVPVLQKPFRVVTLLSMVREMLDR
jgi:two-component system, cell cycle sensor histidine kinase and response regulator CckA